MANPVGEVIAFCPKCNKSIRDQNPYAWCVECGEQFTPEIKAKIPHLVQQEQQAQVREQRAQQATENVGDAHLKAPIGSPALNRYLDLYRVARGLVEIGKTVKVIGMVVGGGIILLGLFVGATFGIFGLVFGAFVGGIIFLLGILISAQGQMLLAQADSAVHTSPFMTGDEKAKVMSL